MMTTGDDSTSDKGDRAFHASFHDQEHSAFVAELTRRVVREHELAKRREQVFRGLDRYRRRTALAPADAIQ